MARYRLKILGTIDVPARDDATARKLAQDLLYKMNLRLNDGRWIIGGASYQVHRDGTLEAETIPEFTVGVIEEGNPPRLIEL